MHIPTCQTNELSILTFEDARKTREESACYDR